MPHRAKSLTLQRCYTVRHSPNIERSIYSTKSSTPAEKVNLPSTQHPNKNQIQVSQQIRSIHQIRSLLFATTEIFLNKCSFVKSIYDKIYATAHTSKAFLLPYKLYANLLSQYFLAIEQTNSLPLLTIRARDKRFCPE